jgi:hypothetical protein
MEPLQLPILISPREQRRNGETYVPYSSTKKTIKDIEMNLNNLACHIIKLEDQESLKKIQNNIEDTCIKLELLESHINFDISYLRSSIDVNYKLLSERIDYIENKASTTKSSISKHVIQLAICSFIAYIIFRPGSAT